MRHVTVLILLPPSSARPDTPVGWLERAREAVAEQHRATFEDLGAAEVRIVREAPDGRTFGQRLRGLATDVAAGASAGRAVGLVVLGGGAMPLARRDDLEEFVKAASASLPRALANSYYSADAFAVPDARVLTEVPDLPSDNALPRWLAERAGIPVADLRARSRLAIDIDSPIDVPLVARHPGCPPALDAVARAIADANPAVVRALDGVAATLRDRRAELVVAGRTSSRTLGWLEQNAACRVRALVEERGLRARTDLALGSADTDDLPVDESDPVDDSGLTTERPSRELIPSHDAGSNRRPSGALSRQRPPRSILGLAIDDRGPQALGEILGELGDAAVIDTRVLLAHRLGSDEAGWPPLADRLASDLLRPSEVRDPWLRALTESAAAAPIPVLLGGHTLVGPGLPLLGRPGRLDVAP